VALESVAENQLHTRSGSRTKSILVATDAESEMVSALDGCAVWCNLSLQRVRGVLEAIYHEEGRGSKEG